MLDQLRQGAQGWISKLLMGLLVLSFAIWGIGGFNGYHADQLARVGNTTVSMQEFGRLYEQAQRNAQRSGKQASPDQVLSAVMMNAAIDDAAGDYGLGVSDDRVAGEIAKNPAFLNTEGKFDRDRFSALLENARISHNDFVRDLKRDLVRAQIQDTVGAGLSVPQPLVAAFYRLQRGAHGFLRHRRRQGNQAGRRTGRFRAADLFRRQQADVPGARIPQARPPHPRSGKDRRPGRHKGRRRRRRIRAPQGDLHAAGTAADRADPL